MQPFETPRFACMINGEIYNYRDLCNHYPCDLRSNSDCEIVVHLFEKIVGTEKSTIKHMKTLIGMLDGEFAIIIYEFATNDVFYGVDQVRARPLFIGHANSKQEIWLASELKGMASAREVHEVRAGECGHIVKPWIGFEMTRGTHFSYDALREVPQLENAKFTFPQSAERVHDLFMENLRLKSNPERQAG